jgi:hypothetical protein
MGRKKSFLLMTVFLIIIAVPLYVYAGEGFTINLISNGGCDINDKLDLHATITDYVYEDPTSAIEFIVNYNSDYLIYNSYTVNQAVYEAVYISDSVLSNNEIKYVIAFLGSDNALEKTEHILDLNFTPIKKGSTSVKIGDVRAATYKGNIFVPNIVNAVITISDSYDVNKDGIINIADVAITSYYCGKSADIYPECDVDNDNDIDRRDVELIIDYINKNNK